MLQKQPNPIKKTKKPIKPTGNRRGGADEEIMSTTDKSRTSSGEWRRRVSAGKGRKTLARREEGGEGEAGQSGTIRKGGAGQGQAEGGGGGGAALCRGEGAAWRRSYGGGGAVPKGGARGGAVPRGIGGVALGLW
ncbi:hypothetical protein ABZP36_003712 [Zizania latifolia]